MTIDTTIGKRPISDDSSAGSDIRDSVEFEQIQGEIDKLTAISGNGPVNWEQLAKFCETTIASKSKDLLITCYLNGALLETQGLEGLSAGLHVLSDLLETYWDNLFPTIKRLRARRNAVQWLVDRISQKSQDASWQDKPADGELIDDILETLRKIDATLSEKDEEAPSMHPLLSLLSGFPRIEPPSETPEPDAKATASTAASTTPTSTEQAAAPTSRPPGSASSSAPPTSAPLDNTLEADKANDLLNERLGELANWYQSIDLENPTPYRVKRIAIWSPISDLPPSRNGKTFIPGPQAQNVEIVKRLEAGGSPEEVIRFAENQLGIEPLWLDMNRLVAQALALSGPRFIRAQKAVESETARFIARLPKLPELCFINERPFANEATKAWLNTLEKASWTSGRASPDNDPANQAIREARTYAAAGKWTEAATRIQREIVPAKSAHQRFCLRLRLFEILAVQSQQHQLLAFASILQTEIERFNLEEWEPELALEGLKLIHHWLKSDSGSQSEAARILARITLLDPATAVDLITTTGAN